METVRRPKPIGGRERWHIDEYAEEGWLFRVKEGVNSVYFDHLGYTNEARKSYQDFCRLRADGVIPAGVRFQVALPLTESAVRFCVTNLRDYELMHAAYEEAMSQEIAELVRAVPAHDLVIQWDINLEVFAIALQDRFGTPWQPSGDPFERYLKALNAVASHVPDEALMGLHLCYGELGHKHFMEPTDLSVVVRMANGAQRAVTRQIDYLHMPVPRNRDDVAYFAALRDLDVSDAMLYLGLVHFTDGLEGSLRRAESARQSLSSFGVATECGWGHRAKETLPQLFRIHRDVAAAL